ncbi:hypothetical protein BLL42_23680 [Pseudomonas frederiksbergensis]|uniref:SMODS and SLOG-associating 2TM effector domain-containing protein n=1 Tax=Pseudomonas frederiksbergensis TaxID=104087 RepID=A0A1J0EQX8_9PSED|nr:hypothetical protein [Pseudomonas frederiksbergensis]APC18565.1 hypothetical protein BLL42_23680 [Pseudomonas frederiksbergensis]
MGEVSTDLADRWHDMLFGIRRSIRYHQRRRAFFDRLDQFSNMLSVIFGSAAIYGILEKNALGIALLASATVTILASINLVIGSAQRARAHADFMRRYVELEKLMLQPQSEECLLGVTQSRLSIEAEEPPVLHVLNCICHNETMRAMGYKKEQLVKVGWFQRLVSQLFDFRESAIH